VSVSAAVGTTYTPGLPNPPGQGFNFRFATSSARPLLKKRSLARRGGLSEKCRNRRANGTSRPLAREATPTASAHRRKHRRNAHLLRPIGTRDIVVHSLTKFHGRPHGGSAESSSTAGRVRWRESTTPVPDVQPTGTPPITGLVYTEVFFKEARVHCAGAAVSTKRKPGPCCRRLSSLSLPAGPRERGRCGSNDHMSRTPDAFAMSARR